MDLPTYTNIWRIEKRLYKLYDLRLPMPLPLVQVGVFIGVFVPWIVLLRLAGIPFGGGWLLTLYLVPPAVLTWLATRPVIEGKRLTELLLSQVRYLAEPRTWCRLTPIREPRDVVITARVWRRTGRAGRSRRAGRAPVPAPGAVRDAAGTDPAARAATPRPLEEFEDHSARAGAAGQAVTRGTPPSFGANARALLIAGGMLTPAGEPQADERADGTRPDTRSEAVSAERAVELEPPPATPRLEMPPGDHLTARAHPEAAPRAPGAPHRPAEPHGERAPQGSAGAPPIGSGKRGLASGVRRPGQAAEFWAAIAPPPAVTPDAGTAPPAEQDGTTAPPERDGTAAPAERDDAAAPAERDDAAAPAEPAERDDAAAPSPQGGAAAPSESAGAVRSGGDGAVRPRGDGAATPAVDGDDTAVPSQRAEATESSIAGAPAGQGDGESEQRAPARLEIPPVPSAFGAGDAPKDREEAAPEPVAGVTSAGGTADEGSAGDEAAAIAPAVDAGAVPAAAESALEEADEAARERDDATADREEDREGAAAKAPPKPWSKELSRPARDGRADALVWPPPGTKPAGAPSRSSSAPEPSTTESVTPERSTSEPGVSDGAGSEAAEPGAETVSRRAQAPRRKVRGFAVPPPGDSDGGGDADGAPPAGTAGTPGRPVTPFEGRQSPWSMPRPTAKSPAAPGTRLPPPAVPDVRPEPQGSPPPSPAPSPPPAPPPAPPPPAPAREVRSGPASPVRPRPLTPPPPPPPPSTPAITPPGADQEDGTGGGLRRLIKAVGGSHGQVESDYTERLRRPFQGTRRIVVLGCTGGAGQTVTALMLGHTFAQFSDASIAAIDVNPGPGALARRTRGDAHETLTGLITHAGQVTTQTAMRRYASRAKSGLDVIAAGKNPLQALDDRDYALAIRTIDRFYAVTMLDAAAAVVARVLPHADQIVLVAPASADAPRAVTMTFEWLDGHGYGGLRSSAVTVINGVSRRSMDDVEQAEAVARGRCRALVRIPWDDHLSLDRSPRNELKSLRAPTRRAYLALAGVVAGGFGALPERYVDVEVAGDQQQEASR